MAIFWSLTATTSLHVYYFHYFSKQKEKVYLATKISPDLFLAKNDVVPLWLYFEENLMPPSFATYENMPGCLNAQNWSTQWTICWLGQKVVKKSVQVLIALELIDCT